MSDEQGTGVPPVEEHAESTPVDREADTKPEGMAAPVGYVKGGGAVLTGPYEKKMAEEWAASEASRAMRDEERRVAGIPIDAGGAVEHEHRLTTEEESMLPEAYVLLRFVDSKGEPIYMNGSAVEQRADIKAPDSPAWPGELMLLMFCPRCIQRGLLPVDHCIMQVRQSNRRWHLHPKGQGEMFFWREGSEIIPYRSAGQICESEKIVCSTCGWACHIDKNVVKPA